MKSWERKDNYTLDYLKLDELPKRVYIRKPRKKVKIKKERDDTVERSRDE